MDAENSLVPVQKNDYLFVATNPSEMSNAQSSLIQWFTQKVESLKQELEEVEQALETAKKHKWAISTLRNQVSRTAKTKLFYEKCLSALNAGFYLIPDFPIETFAIRTTKQHPKEDISTSNPWHPSLKPDGNLPEGQGEYVSAEPVREFYTSEKTVENGKEYEKKFYYNSDFKEIQFPLIALKPEVMNQTAQAMMLKLFDEVGICPRQHARDPMIIGRILGPKVGYAQRSLNFLISWYIDVRDL